MRQLRCALSFVPAMAPRPLTPSVPATLQDSVPSPDTPVKHGRFPAMGAVEDRFRVQTGPLSEESTSVAEVQLRETPERVAEALHTLRELIRGE